MTMRRSALTLAALLIASIPSFAAQPQTRIAQAGAQSSYQQGETLLDQGNYEAALSLFDQAIRANPNFAFPYSGRCAAYLALGNGQAATADCDRAILLNPTPALFYVRRGYLRLAQGNVEGAQSDAEQALLDDPNSAEAHHIYGETFIDLGEFEAALLDLNLALRLDPNFARAYGSRGEARLALGNREAAVRDYVRAVQIDARTPITPSLRTEVASEFITMGEARLANEDLEGALQEFDLALQIDPTFAPAYAGRGEVFLAAGDEESAKAEFEQALDFDPSNVTARNRLQELEPPEPSPTPTPASTATPGQSTGDEISLDGPQSQEEAEAFAKGLDAAFEQLDICGPIDTGTTYDEVVEIIGQAGTLVSSDGDVEEFTWSGTREVEFQGNTETATYGLRATFVDGAIEDFECQNTPGFLQS